MCLHHLYYLRIDGNFVIPERMTAPRTTRGSTLDACDPPGHLVILGRDSLSPKRLRGDCCKASDVIEGVQYVPARGTSKSSILAPGRLQFAELA